MAAQRSYLAEWVVCPSHRGSGGPWVKVLIVEDDPEFRSFLQVYVDGLEAVDGIRLASSGDEALRAAGEEPFDVAVIDFNLGDSNGEIVARSLKERCAGIKVVGFSGSTERIDWADHVIVKGGRMNLELLNDAIRKD